jgi:2-oxoglutarate ferredoxin oxidoreductase subunit alpha
MPVAVLYPKMLFPLPSQHIGEFIRDRKAVIVPELNFTGQFARMLRAEFWREVHHLNSYGGVPLSTREVFEKIKQVYETLTVKA